jgi:hypothetical protein
MEALEALQRFGVIYNHPRVTSLADIWLEAEVGGWVRWTPEMAEELREHLLMAMDAMLDEVCQTACVNPPRSTNLQHMIKCFGCFVEEDVDYTTDMDTGGERWPATLEGLIHQRETMAEQRGSRR